jgi:hypothetical protein
MIYDIHIQESEFFDDVFTNLSLLEEERMIENISDFEWRKQNDEHRIFKIQLKIFFQFVVL